MAVAVNSATNQVNYGIGYDANGNWMGVSGSPNTWNVENKLVSTGAVDGNGNAQMYTYDPWGKRVLEFAAGPGGSVSGTLYFYSITGQRLGTAPISTYGLNGGALVPVLYFGGRLLAPVDRLGSVRQNGNNSVAYYPWGEERTSTPDNTDKFATYFRDMPGQDYANARYYSATMGRFWSPDPMGEGAVDPHEPRGWNRYAYSGDDPVTHNDPSGLFICTACLPPPPDPPPPDPGDPGPGPGLPCTTAVGEGALDSCGPHGPSTSTSFSEIMRARAANAIKDMSAGCESALGAIRDLYDGTTSLLYKVNVLNTNGDVFYNGTTASLASEPMSSWGVTGNSTLTGVWLANMGAAAFVGVNSDGTPNNQVVLGPLFFAESAASQAITLIHEVLHTYTGLGDIALGAALGLPASLLQSVSSASPAISQYLSDQCNMTTLKQNYGLN
jgi:RHS repeat-associated protein